MPLFISFLELKIGVGEKLLLASLKMAVANKNISEIFPVVQFYLLYRSPMCGFVRNTFDSKHVFILNPIIYHWVEESYWFTCCTFKKPVTVSLPRLFCLRLRRGK